MLCRLPDYAASAGCYPSPPAFRCLWTRHNHIASPDWQACRIRRDDMTTLTSEEGTSERLLDDCIGPFLQQLRDAGYAERTLRKKRTVTKALARWVKRKRIAIVDLNDDHVAAFVARWPRRREAHVKCELAVLRLFFRYLRAEATILCPAPQGACLGCRRPAAALRRGTYV